MFLFFKVEDTEQASALGCNSGKYSIKALPVDTIDTSIPYAFLSSNPTSFTQNQSHKRPTVVVSPSSLISSPLRKRRKKEKSLSDTEEKSQTNEEKTEKSVTEPSENMDVEEVNDNGGLDNDKVNSGFDSVKLGGDEVKSDGVSQGESVYASKNLEQESSDLCFPQQVKDGSAESETLHEEQENNMQQPTCEEGTNKDTSIVKETRSGDTSVIENTDKEQISNTDETEDDLVNEKENDAIEEKVETDTTDTAMTTTTVSQQPAQQFVTDKVNLPITTSTSLSSSSGKNGAVKVICNTDDLEGSVEKSDISEVSRASASEVSRASAQPEILGSLPSIGGSAVKTPEISKKTSQSVKSQGILTRLITNPPDNLKTASETTQQIKVVQSKVVALPGNKIVNTLQGSNHRPVKVVKKILSPNIKIMKIKSNVIPSVSSNTVAPNTQGASSILQNLSQHAAGKLLVAKTSRSLIRPATSNLIQQQKIEMKKQVGGSTIPGVSIVSLQGTEKSPNLNSMVNVSGTTVYQGAKILQQQQPISVAQQPINMTPITVLQSNEQFIAPKPATYTVNSDGTLSLANVSTNSPQQIVTPVCYTVNQDGSLVLANNTLSASTPDQLPQFVTTGIESMVTGAQTVLPGNGSIVSKDISSAVNVNDYECNRVSSDQPEVLSKGIIEEPSADIIDETQQIEGTKTEDNKQEIVMTADEYKQFLTTNESSIIQVTGNDNFDATSSNSESLPLMNVREEREENQEIIPEGFIDRQITSPAEEISQVSIPDRNNIQQLVSQDEQTNKTASTQNSGIFFSENSSMSTESPSTVTSFSTAVASTEGVKSETTPQLEDQGIYVVRNPDGSCQIHTNSEEPISMETIQALMSYAPEQFQLSTT